MIPLLKKLKNPFIQQNLLEILFPLVGFFWFDWSIVLIAGYYYIDFIADKTAFIRRYKWIRKQHAVKINKPSLRLFASILILLPVLIGLISYYGMMSSLRLTPKLFNSELVEFVKNELWILLPVILVLYYFKDAMMFVAPRRYLLYNERKYMRFEVLKSSLSFFGTLLLFLLWSISQTPDWVALFAFVLGKSFLDFYVFPTLHKSALNGNNSLLN